MKNQTISEIAEYVDKEARKRVAQILKERDHHDIKE